MLSTQHALNGIIPRCLAAQGSLPTLVAQPPGRDSDPQIFQADIVLQRPYILIVGSGRSGTTWLADEVAARVRTHPVFEPLHRYRVPGVPHWGKRGEHAGKYLTAHDDDAEMKRFFERLLRGEISNAWTRQDWRCVPTWAQKSTLVERCFYHWAARRNRRRTLQGTHSVFKLIKANLMLEWLDQNFDVRLLYVIRHPCQVIGSRMKHAWQGDLADITQQDKLVHQELRPFRTIIESAKTPLQQLAVFWSVENRIPLRQLPFTDWKSLAYEECLFETERVFDSIDRFLDKPTAATNSTAGASRTPHVIRPKVERPWYDPLTEKQGEEVLEYCHGFGIRLYGRSLRPQTTLADAIH